MKHKKIPAVLIWVLFICIAVGLAGCEINFSDESEEKEILFDENAARTNGEWVLEAIHFPDCSSIDMIKAEDGSVCMRVFNDTVFQYDYTPPPKKLKPGDVYDCDFSFYFVEIDPTGRNDLFRVRHQAYITMPGEDGRMQPDKGGQVTLAGEWNYSDFDENGECLNWIYFSTETEERGLRWKDENKLSVTNSVTYIAPSPWDWVSFPDSILEIEHNFSLTQTSYIIYEYHWKEN